MFLPSSYVEAVTPSVTVLGKRTYKEGIKGERSRKGGGPIGLVSL
jgi:hypothetical protein